MHESTALGIANAIENDNNNARTHYLSLPRTPNTTLTPMLKTQFATVPPEEAPVGEIEYHPFANVFRMMTEAELAELAENIELQGLRRAVILFEGKVLDGRNRYRACLLNGLQPHFKQFLGTEDEALEFVESENRHRRHESVADRALSAARLVTLKQGIWQKHRSTLPIGNQQTLNEVAKRFKVSKRTVSRATKILHKAIPEVIRKLEDGEMTIGKADIVSNLSPRKQKQYIVNSRRIAAETVASLRVKSLKALEGFKGLVYISPQFNWSDPDLISGLLQAMQSMATSYATLNKTKNYGSIFNDGIFELEEDKVSAQKLDDIEKILAVIDHSEVVEMSDLKRLSKIPKDRFDLAIGELVERNRIELMEMGGKNPEARGARKLLVKRKAEPEKGEKPTRNRPEEPEDVYYDRWD